MDGLEADALTARAMELSRPEAAMSASAEDMAAQVAAFEKANQCLADEAFAKTLAEEAGPSYAINTDADFARRLQREMDSEVEDSEAASVALALALSDEANHDPKRRKPRAMREQPSEALRQQLFSSCGAGERSAAHAAAPQPPVAPVIPACSYSMVVGQAPGASARGSAGSAAVAPSPAPVYAAARTRAPRVASSPAGPALIIDGANVAWAYGRSRFDAYGIELCVQYFMHRGAGGGSRLPRSRIAVVLNENRWDGNDPILSGLIDVISWTPTNKDDDVFLLQCACDNQSWVVTNDKWTDHRATRHATDGVRHRKLRFAFVGQVFTVAADDVARFDGAVSVG